MWGIGCPTIMLSLFRVKPSKSPPRTTIPTAPTMAVWIGIRLGVIVTIAQFPETQVPGKGILVLWVSLL